MTAPHADQLIEGYLARVRAAASDLPSSARDELLADMRSHIAEARARESDETDATILNILDRLGEPAIVVADARERLDLKAESAYRPGSLEIAAVVLLPFLWPVAVILLWLSPAWKVRDKIIGSIFSLGGYPTIFILAAAFARPVFMITSGSGSCVSSSDGQGNIIQSACNGPSALELVGTLLHLTLTIGFFLLPVLAAGYLALRLRWGRRMEAATA